MKLKCLSVALAALSLAFLVGCQEAEPPTVTPNYFFIMNTTAFVVIPDEDIASKQTEYTSLLSETQTLLESIDKSLSTSRDDSVATLFNNATAGERVEVDGVFYAVLSTALEMYTITSGYYNPAVYYSVADYGFNGSAFPTTTEGFPSDDTAAKYVTLAESFSSITLEEVEGKYYATKPQTTIEVGGEMRSLKLDLGGIGKGYAADKVNELMDKYGFQYGLFNFGSSSISVKKYIANLTHEYNLSLINPRGEDTYLSFKVKDKMISTSGDYENYYEIDSQRYCHIINPKTARPINNGMMSATVIGGSAAENDALSTAIMAMDKEFAAAFIGTLEGRQVVFSYEDDGYKFQTTLPDYEIRSELFVKA